MIIGLLGDSHGRTRTTAAAVAALRERGAQRLIHLGDFETIDVIDELVGFDAFGVLGNCDHPAEDMIRYARHVGVQLDRVQISMTVDGKQLVATHGHIQRAIVSALDAGVAYLVHGHSHELRDEMVGSTRILNPGALARAKRYTAAVLDTVTNRLEIVEIPHGLD